MIECSVDLCQYNEWNSFNFFNIFFSIFSLIRENWKSVLIRDQISFFYLVYSTRERIRFTGIRERIYQIFSSYRMLLINQITFSIIINYFKQTIFFLSVEIEIVVKPNRIGLGLTTIVGCHKEIQEPFSNNLFIEHFSEKLF